MSSAMDFTTITTNERALLADGQTQLHTIAHKLAHSDTLLRDLDASMQRLVEYMPVVESARREACARRRELVEELREFLMELLGMHDVLRYNGRNFREDSVGMPGVYELDGTECGRPMTAAIANTNGAGVSEEPTSASEGTPPAAITEPSNRVDSASPTTGQREAAPLVTEGKTTDVTAAASSANTRNAGEDHGIPSCAGFESHSSTAPTLRIQSRTPAPAKKPRPSSRAPESIKRLKGTIKPPFFRPSGGAVY
ncbi:hypothetical protein B0A55_13452 [Friedmanniomyces simplex]|uniref:Uncharacterized protein n=1 Tax=Friedmanniomyces simplex TaxID=329884 RepID=A0A4U0VNW0_9PEZI|nr:hypothetical protein B0A55_13452 [Friedmanniomyces simplex]